MLYSASRTSARGPSRCEGVARRGRRLLYRTGNHGGHCPRPVRLHRRCGLLSRVAARPRGGHGGGCPDSHRDARHPRSQRLSAGHHTRSWRGAARVSGHVAQHDGNQSQWQPNHARLGAVDTDARARASAHRAGGGRPPGGSTTGCDLWPTSPWRVVSPAGSDSVVWAVAHQRQIRLVAWRLVSRAGRSSRRGWLVAGPDADTPARCAALWHVARLSMRRRFLYRAWPG